jgi:hypothetical protein
VLRIHELLVWIPIRGSRRMTNGSGFVIDLQDANKKQFLKKAFLLIYFLKVLLHHFSKIESQKGVTKQ